LVRDFLVHEELAKETEEPESIYMGTITLIYNHHTRELGERLTEIQHSFHSSIISTLHVHLDADQCLEVLVVKGNAKLVRQIADQLISTRGVFHGKLVMSAVRPEW
jgi:CopG family nickel-responsive transcriptional regulator